MEINFSFDNDFKELKNEIINKKNGYYYLTLFLKYIFINN